MRTANRIALIQLRLEGIDIRHEKNSKGFEAGGDARWIVYEDGLRRFAFRSPCEALKHRNRDGYFSASYLVF